MDEFGVGGVVPVVMAKPANNRGELLLELLSEEIPARMQRRAIEEFVGLVRDKLAAAEIPATGLRGCVTPRRLTIIAEGIPERQPDRSEERRGPRVGAPQAALDGFLRSAGLSSVEQCEVRDTGRGEFYFAIVQHAGRPAAEVLSELLQAAIAELSWPKSMRFPAARLRWVRPLVSVLCLLDGEVLPLSLDEVPVGNTTRGHRFLSQGEIAVENAADYLERLEAAYVVLDQDRRRDIIAADLDRLAHSEGVTVKSDAGLLEEVTGLVEFPVALMGRIDDESMALPPEVLATAMRTHQKYFSCLKSDGSLAPRFLFVANNLTPDDGKTIVAGNERVLKARLADARFFWDQDCGVPLYERVEALRSRVYYEKLGTMYEKVERMEKLAGELATYVPGADAELARRAARLSKADLSTGMVGEFPELQGVMGYYYAQSFTPAQVQGGEEWEEEEPEDPQVCRAILEHYKPLGPNDVCPTAPVSVVVALADKIDSLVAFFAVGEKPTGSRDPFALRRAALGIIRLILENNVRIGLASSIREHLATLHKRGIKLSQFTSSDVLEFIADRLKVHLREAGVRHDLIAAVFAMSEDDLVRLLVRVDALSNFLCTEDGANLLIAYRRASNIVAIEERQDQRKYDGEVNEVLIRQRGQREEQTLLADLNLVRRSVDRSLANEEFEAAMGHLATLRRPVDEFFEKVTVNADDPALRENRLRLLSRIRAVMSQVADFSQIEG
jgi:glycyl-tRNA synthetase beta chain